MKTLCRDGISYHMFAESNKPVTINSVNVAVGDPVEYYIGDLNSSNCLLYDTRVTEPSEYVAVVASTCLTAQLGLINPSIGLRPRAEEAE